MVHSIAQAEEVSLCVVDEVSWYGMRVLSRPIRLACRFGHEFRGITLEHRRMGAMMLLFLGLLLGACRPSSPPASGEQTLTRYSDGRMLTDPTSVELAAGRPTFVWFFAPF